MRRTAFIRANTRLLPVPLVPEVRLHLAEESLAIWRQTEEELGRLNVPPPWWAFAWAGGQALARYVLDNPALAAGRRVLDLGAGSGLAGIAALKAGAARVLAADTDPFAVAAIALNAAVNHVELEATSDDLLAAPPSRLDLVLVGDLFYERPLAERVLAFLEAARGRGAAVLVGDPRRSYFPRQRFDRVAEYSVPVTRDLEDMEIKRTAVWRLAERGQTPFADLPDNARASRKGV
jgi:predicted nicotinamide N-methyase